MLKIKLPGGKILFVKPCLWGGFAVIVTETKDIGGIIKQMRKSRNMTQAELAALCKVGVRFIGELEYGKSTAMLGKTMQVINKLGIKMEFTAPAAPVLTRKEGSAQWAAYKIPWNPNK
jgi:y4mF family transcriptional regulator